MQSKEVQPETSNAATKLTARQRPAPALKNESFGLAGSILGLQRSHGNREVQRSLNQMVMQRQCACENSADSAGACVECANEQPSLQATAANDAEISAVPASVHEVLMTSGQPLDSATRSFMEPRFEHDFGNVRIHTDQKASKSAREVNALAYTVGHDIVFAEGFYSPGTSDGQRLLAHELTHTVQQANTVARDIGGISEPGDASEQEADRVAEQVMRSVPDAQPADRFGASPGHEGVVFEDEEDGVIFSDNSRAPSGVRTASGAEISRPLVQATLSRSAQRMIMRTPSVASWDFHNTNGTNTAGDNCCALCPRPLGVGNSYNGRLVNGVELRVALNDAFPSQAPGVSYDIKRMSEGAVWEKVGGAWVELLRRPAGTPDDPDDRDECLTPVITPPFQPYIYSEDQPGFGSTAGLNATATEAVFKGTFTESVDINAPTGVIHDPLTLDWHSILWLTKPGGTWAADATRSEIARGTVTVGRTP